MSTPSESGWATPIILIAVGALTFYAVTRGPGNCPANTARSQSAGNEVMSAATGADGEARLLYADESTFDRTVLEADGPVLVDFYADWCGPCQQLAPVLDRVAGDLTEGLIVKVDVDDSPGLMARYNIQSIPTLLVFSEGQVVNKTMGMQSEQNLRSLLQQAR